MGIVRRLQVRVLDGDIGNDIIRVDHIPKLPWNTEQMWCRPIWKAELLWSLGIDPRWRLCSHDGCQSECLGLLQGRPYVSLPHPDFALSSHSLSQPVGNSLCRARGMQRRDESGSLHAAVLQAAPPRDKPLEGRRCAQLTKPSPPPRILSTKT